MHDSKKLTNLIFVGLLIFSFLFMAAPQRVSAIELRPQAVGPETGASTPDLSNAKVQVYYFYSNTCTHCLAVIENIVNPLQNEYPGQVDIWLLELNERVNYEALIAAENQLQSIPDNRDLPVVIIGDQMLVGEEQSNQHFRSMVEEGIRGEAIPFYQLDGVKLEELIVSTPQPGVSASEICSIDAPENCVADNPIYVAYFYQTGCKECARSEMDLAYLQEIYPQLIIEEFNVFDEAGLANWMAERVDRLDDMHTPAIFIADHAWIGEGEIRPQTIEPVLETLLESGTERFWAEYDPDEGSQTLMDRFEQLGWLAVVLAGLVDGLNPCAFATIIFFVSYLTLSGHKGKQILLTGASFTLGVFLAYLAIGLGFYKILDLIQAYLKVLSNIVYALTAVFCLVLAFMSIRDYFKAREGDLDEMAMNLPEPLRKRINATVREGRKSSSYYLSAFLVGLVVSLLELACTGQIYLPVIISMSTLPEMRGQAVLYLMLYNLMFIVPLIVVFVLAFYGTTSRQFSAFLKKNAAAVKIGMAFVFLLLAAWLIGSLLS
jgi:cytochrome c biogenesis protein CcdA